jgi:hypothetical protein
LTGLWQVNGKNRTTFEEMIHWDTKYVETKSPALDLSILLRTLPAVLEQARDTLSARVGSPPQPTHRDRASHPNLADASSLS